MRTNTVRLRTGHVLRQHRNVRNAALHGLATGILEQARQNIDANNQKVTGAMRASGYMVTPLESTYPQAVAEAAALNPKALILPPLEPGDGEATVSFGVNYAIYPELQQSYLQAAGETMAAQAPTIFRRAVNEHMHD